MHFSERSTIPSLHNRTPDRSRVGIEHQNFHLRSLALDIPPPGTNLLAEKITGMKDEQTAEVLDLFVSESFRAFWYRTIHQESESNEEERTPIRLQRATLRWKW